MLAIELPVRDAEDAARLVRALGSHRYVKSRLHLVHALAFAPLDDLGEPAAWAKGVLAELDVTSRDERLWRASSEAEVAAVVGRYWAPGPEGAAAREALRALLRQHGFEESQATPFDEDAEDEMHPLLVDAGWELLAPEELDAERHKGMLAALDEADEDDDFDDEFSLEDLFATPTLLHELPALGARELLDATDSRGLLTQPFVLWVQGPRAYHDYLVRGICRAARIGEPS